MLFLNFAIFVGKHLYEIIKKNYFKKHLHTAASERTLWSDRRVGISKTKLIRKKGLTQAKTLGFANHFMKMKMQRVLTKFGERIENGEYKQKLTLHN